MPTDDIVIPISLLSWEMDSQDKRSLAAGHSLVKMGLRQKMCCNWRHVIGLGLRGPKIGLGLAFAYLLLDTFNTAWIRLVLGS